MSVKFFLDAHIVVYTFFDDGAPTKQCRAQELIKHALRTHEGMRISCPLSALANERTATDIDEDNQEIRDFWDSSWALRSPHVCVRRSRSRPHRSRSWWRAFQRE
jgi:hypothetical protein